MAAESRNAPWAWAEISSALANGASQYTGLRQMDRIQSSNRMFLMSATRHAADPIGGGLCY